jgi:hypothetical protein
MMMIVIVVGLSKHYDLNYYLGVADKMVNELKCHVLCVKVSHGHTIIYYKTIFHNNRFFVGHGRIVDAADSYQTDWRASTTLSRHANSRAHTRHVSNNYPRH